MRCEVLAEVEAQSLASGSCVPYVLLRCGLPGAPGSLYGRGRRWGFAYLWLSRVGSGESSGLGGNLGTQSKLRASGERRWCCRSWVSTWNSNPRLQPGVAVQRRLCVGPHSAWVSLQPSSPWVGTGREDARATHLLAGTHLHRSQMAGWPDPTSLQSCCAARAAWR